MREENCRKRYAGMRKDKEQTMGDYSIMINRIQNEVRKVVSGKDNEIRLVLTAILSGGHILLEDIPGVGKTTMALAFSKAMELDYRRVQFTPDVLPTDVVGFNIYGRDGIEDIYKPGPVMCNLFLADEINRTSSKTQSALLEVMEEGKVTVDSVTRDVPQPFTVIATQNPMGSVGTQMLPESQLDRFMIKLSMGYPDTMSEIELLKERHMGNPMDQVVKVMSKNELLMMQQEAEKVFVHDTIFEYIARLSAASRENDMIALGLSPRASLAILSMAKTTAMMYGRNYVIPDDVQFVFEPVSAHRIVPAAKAKISRVPVSSLIKNILFSVPVPRLVN